MADADIIRKIKGALAIAHDDNASDGEIQAAMNAVQKMMDRHHLTEDDLAHEPADDYKAVDAAEMGRARSWIGGKAYLWEQWLGSFVSDFVGCPVYLDTAEWARNSHGLLMKNKSGEPWRGRSMVFYGITEDATIAAELFAELRVIIATLAQAKFATVYQGDGGRYAEGFVTGLFAKMREGREIAKLESRASSTAMVLVARRDDLVKYKEKAARAWLKKETGIKPRKRGSSSGASGNHDSYSEGIKDGRNTEVSAVRCKKLT